MARWCGRSGRWARRSSKGDPGRTAARVRGRPLRGATHRLEVASAQVKSAILLAGLAADGDDDGGGAFPVARSHRADAA